MHSFVRIKTLPLLNSKVVVDLIGTLTIQMLLLLLLFQQVENAILSLWETVEREIYVKINQSFCTNFNLAHSLDEYIVVIVLCIYSLAF